MEPRFVTFPQSFSRRMGIKSSESPNTAMFALCVTKMTCRLSFIDLSVVASEVGHLLAIAMGPATDDLIEALDDSFGRWRTNWSGEDSTDSRTMSPVAPVFVSTKIAVIDGR